MLSRSGSVGGASSPRCMEVICDGDANTITTLNDHKSYGDQVMITKDECVGHVQKRMGNRLEKPMVDFRRDKSVAKEKVKVLKD